MYRVNYLSDDQLNQAEARQLALAAEFLDVHASHLPPVLAEVGDVDAVIVDLDHAPSGMLDDFFDFVFQCLANEKLVGVQTYYRHDPRLTALQRRVVFGKDFESALVGVLRLARRRDV